MGKLKISIHPTFFIFALILIYFGKFLLFLIYLLTLFLHELAHAFVASRLGYRLKNIKLIPFGICLNLQSNILKPKDEMKIALAGPILNFIICIGLISLWWVFPSIYNYTNLFCYANLVTGLFNLIPAFPLDGGRVLFAIFKEFSISKQAIKLSKIVNIVISVVLLVMFIVSCFYSINFTYLFVIFCVLSGVFETDNKNTYSIINFTMQKKIGKILKVKQLFVSEDEILFKVFKYIDSFSYLKIYIYDKNKNIMATLFEKDFVNLLEKNLISISFKEALKLY